MIISSPFLIFIEENAVSLNKTYFHYLYSLINLKSASYEDKRNWERSRNEKSIIKRDYKMK